MTLGTCDSIHVSYHRQFAMAYILQLAVTQERQMKRNISQK